VGPPEGKRPQGIPGCRREDSIKIDLRERGWGDMDWIHPTQERNQWATLNDPSDFVKCWEIHE
jgi:hypothetical protein